MSPFMTHHPEYFSTPQPGVVTEDILPNCLGRVKFRASLWRAKLRQPSSQVVHEGQVVIVIGRQGLTLLVQPIS